MKIRKKRIKKIAITLTVLLILGVAATNYVKYTYKDHIIRILQNYANKHLQTKVLVARKDITFHVLQTFPHVSVQLKNILVKSSDTFNAVEFSDIPGSDTLLFARRIFLEFDLIKMLKKQYELKEFNIDQGICNLLIDSQKKNNYSIWKKDTAGPASFNIELKKIKFSKISLNYIARSGHFSMHSYIENQTLKGSLNSSESELALKSNGIIYTITRKGKEFITDKSFEFDLIMFTDAQQIKIYPGQLNLDGIALTLEGQYTKIPEKYLSISLKAGNSSIGGIVNKLKKANLNIGKLQFTKGKISVALKLEGYLGKDFPRIQSEFNLRNAHATYHGNKTIKLEKIYVAGSANVYKNKNLLSWKIKIDSLMAWQSKSRINGHFYITENSHQSFDCDLYAYLDLQDLQNYSDSLPFTCNNGKANLSVVIKKGKPASFKNIPQLISQIHLAKLSIQDASVVFKEWPGEITGVNGDIIFRQNTLFADSLYFTHNGDDILMNATITDFSKAISSTGNQINLKGKIYSNVIHFDNWTGSGNDNNDVGIFPDNLFLDFTSKINTFYIKDHIFTRVSGKIKYQPHEWSSEKMEFYTIDGKCEGDAFMKYMPPNAMRFKSTASITGADIHKLFNEYQNFGQDVITSQNLTGKLFADIQLQWTMDPDFSIKLPSIYANGNIEIKDGELIKYEPLYRLSRFIDIKELSHLKYKTLHCNITINDETVKLEKLNIISPDFTITGNGFHTFENKYEYKIQSELSELLTKRAKRKNNLEFGNVIDDGLGKITIPLIISGNADDIKIVYDKHYTVQNFRQRLREERNTLRDLFSSSADTTGHSPDSTSNPGGKNNQSSSGFTIEWDDSEDDE